VMGKSFISPGVRHGGIRGGSTVHRWGPRFQGRWLAGWHAPGGWTAHRRPVVGYVLPSYWINPSYRIGNYGGYGLPAPVDGYGWSRYYDDAVMVDRHGRVRDHRSDVDWDAHDGGDLPRGAPYDDDVTAHVARHRPMNMRAAGPGPGRTTKAGRSAGNMKAASKAKRGVIMASNMMLHPMRLRPPSCIIAVPASRS
jgi:hypothetical protein